jgi:hypothetical protein
MKASRVIVVIFCLGVALRVAGQSAEETVGLTNGRAWTQWSRAEKRGYVRGALDGLDHGETYLKLVRKCKCEIDALKKYYAGSTYGEMIEAVDVFYNADIVHRAIPIPFAFEIVAMKARGASEDEVKSRVSELLRAFNN